MNVKWKGCVCNECGAMPVSAPGLRRTCYGRDRRRRLGIPAHPHWGKHKTCRQCGGTPIKGRGLCSRCYGHQLEQKHPDRRRMQKYRANQTRYFGGRFVEIMNAAEWKCERCGLADAESLERWDRHLDIHHQDGNGRLSDQPNHKFGNLEVLCCSCHRTTHHETRRLVAGGIQ